MRNFRNSMVGSGRRAAWAMALIMSAASVGARAQDGGEVPRYRIQSLGEFQDTVEVNPYDISNRGDVVGFVSTRSTAVPFLYRNGHMRALPLPPGTEEGLALALNNRGDVVGSVGDNEGLRPALWRNGKFVDPRRLLGQPVESLGKINDAGQMTGAAGPENSRAFFYDGTSTHFLSLPGVHIQRAADLAQDGTVLAVGIQQTLEWRGWLYRDGHYTPLPSPGPSVRYEALNDMGQAIGFTSGNGTPGIGGDLYLYSDGVARRLEKFGGATTEIIGVFDLNNHGWNVGQLYLEGDINQLESFLYRDGRMYLFDDLVRPFGARGWTDLQVLRVNDTGQLMGIGSFEGAMRGFVASPVPEPGSWALMAVGLGVAGAAARRRSSRQ